MPQLQYEPPYSDAWAPKERIPVSVFADKYRNISAGTSSEPGQYRVIRTPYMAEVLDTFNDTNIDLINFVSSARVGKTETVTNMMLYAIDQQPGTWLQIYPTEKLVYRACDRVFDAINDSPRIKEHIIDAGWKNKTGLSLDTMKIDFGWAGSPTTLIDITARFIGFDEVDNCEIASGQLGNTLRLAMERVATWGTRSQCIATTTPKFKDGSAWRMWLRSDKRRYHVPCPKCGYYQVLTFKQIRVDNDERDPDVILNDDLAYYECIDCKYKIRDKNKKREWMVARGVWVPECKNIIQRLPVKKRSITNRAVVGHRKRWIPEIEGDDSINRVAGFHMWVAYSPWRTLSRIMYQWYTVKNNPDELRVFINQWLGEPWQDAIDEVEDTFIKDKRAGSHPRGLVPNDVKALVAGADVQKNNVYWVVRGWADFRRSYLIAEGICADLDELYEIVREGYPYVDGKSSLDPMYLAIDTGYLTEMVYEFANDHPGVYPVKGQPSVLYTVKGATIFYTPQGKIDTRKVQLYHVNTPYYKESLIKSMSVPSGEPGEWKIHRETSDDYCVQVTSEHLVWITATVQGAKRRKPVWQLKTIGQANHYLDAEVYALAIADMKGLTKMRPTVTKSPKPKKPKITVARFLQKVKTSPPV